MILVTGGTGLVGSHLLLRLAENGAAVRSLYRTEESLQNTRNVFAYHGKPQLFDTIQWAKGDILDVPSLEIAFQGIEQVYHSAAFVSLDPKDEEILRKVNIEGTANMVNCALAFGVKKFCHVSSIAALGDVLNPGDVITEETEWNPEKRHDDYAISKYGAEMEVWRAWQEGLNTVVVNPGIIFGPCFWHHGSSKIIKAVKRGQLFYTKGICGFTGVDDVVQSMIALMQTDISGERFTIVSENLTYQEVLNIIANALGKKHPSVAASRLLTSFGWRADWVVSKLFRKDRALTRNMARSAHAQETYSTEKLHKALTQYSFSDLRSLLNELSQHYLT
jgi:nucleoside-diphosphate-sugar epimerase